MTAKEKAVELYSKYEQLGRDFTRGVSMKEFSKECALIAVDEIVEALENNAANSASWLYYEEVKQEIERL
jgi:hypothetical protein